MMTEKPHYSHKPLGSVRALAFATKTPLSDLHKLARQAPKLYRVVNTEEAKGQGRLKVIYEPAPALKAFQQRLIKTVLASVAFPAYINGGVPKRSYRDDCALHTSAEHIVKLDIASFYESVSRAEVRKLWQRFFNLPRGAPTSSYLANLLFWHEEPCLHTDFSAAGIRYSRYVDDISLSSTAPLDSSTVEAAIARLYGMFKSKGIKPNRKKQHVMRRGGALRVHNINVGEDQPSIPKFARDQVRAGLHNFERELAENGLTQELQDTVRHLKGKVAWLKHFHPECGLKAQQKLAQILSEA